MNWTTNSYNYMLYGNAEVAELADAHGSGPCGSNTVRVQVPSSARKKQRTGAAVSFVIPPLLFSVSCFFEGVCHSTSFDMLIPGSYTAYWLRPCSLA